jgi:hypothetical protein
MGSNWYLEFIAWKTVTFSPLATWRLLSPGFYGIELELASQITTYRGSTSTGLQFGLTILKYTIQPDFLSLINAVQSFDTLNNTNTFNI